MDLLDVVILALRLALVLVLYVFLATVVRISARELRAAPRATAAVDTPTLLRLMVLAAGGSSLTAGEVLEVQPGATLGRSEQAGLVLADPAVSADHARLLRVGRAWVLSDLGSTNGTLVNEAPVRGDTPLAVGDVLRLGNVRLQVVGH